MRVYIFGIAGGMGKRYSAILKELGHEVTGEDIQEKTGKLSEADAIIIATPTSTHAAVLRSCLSLGKPILCEKPVCKDMLELKALMSECFAAGTRLQMVSQYDYLASHDEGPSYWDYFKSGNDGLAWDCIQIIYHAKKRPSLYNKSHRWACMINGSPLRIEEMDSAYFWMIQDWLIAPRDDIYRILVSHQKVIDWEAGCTAS